MSESAAVHTVSSRLVYENRWMRVREDEIRRHDGSSGIYGVVEKPDFVVVAPFEGDRVHLVEQFRYPVGARYWELPQGSVEQAPESDPADAARRELLEETGLEAGRLLAAGHLFLGYGYSTQGYHVYLATELRRRTPAREPEEQDMVARAFGVEELERMIKKGQIKDATTVAAIGLLRLKLLL